MRAWRCSHDDSHPVVEADAHPGNCRRKVGLFMECSARMTEVQAGQRSEATTTRTDTEKGTTRTAMALITVDSGAPEVEPGTYTVTLTAIDGPRTIVPQTGPNAGKEVDIFDWTFATEDGQEIQATSSTLSGPRSKMYEWLTALFGAAPPVGSSFDAKDLVGRMAIATVVTSDTGWPRVKTMSAMPTARKAKKVAPPPPPPAPVAEEEEESDDELVADLPWK